MKKILLIIFAILIMLSGSGSVNAFVISDAYWAQVAGSGADKILPIQIKAAGAPVAYAYMLSSAGLGAFVADLALAEAFYNDDDTMKGLIQSAINQQAETWTRDQAKKKFVSSHIQPGPDGPYLAVPVNFYNIFGSQYYNKGGSYAVNDFHSLLNPAWDASYQYNLPFTFRMNLYYYKGDAYDDMKYELDVTNVNSTYWSLRNNPVPCGLSGYACDNGYTCTCSSDGLIHEIYFWLPPSSVLDGSYKVPYITADNSNGYKAKAYYIAVKMRQDGYGSFNEIYQVIWAFFASDEFGPSNDVELKGVIASLTNAVPTNIVSPVETFYTDFFSNPANAHRNQAAYGDANDTTYNQVNNYVTNNVSTSVNETVNNQYYQTTNNQTVISTNGTIQQQGQSSSGTFIGGSYGQQRAGDAFEPLYDDFSTLFSNFFTSVKATSLFSMPGHLTNNLPSSEVCTYSLNCGSFGIHTVSFCNWATALLILKAIVLLAFSAWALRIVILKG
ncbi:MAG: hypothetical protein NTV87_00110 [Ignavibacteriae bacterium]|nr:hypothetical protein [Ignavibacteriota bacterium]